ncbi:MAG: S26 family signal peptidase [Candidatus Scalindua sp.]
MSKTKQKDINGKKKDKNNKGFIRENLESIIIAVALAFVLRMFVVEAFKIPTGSMAPTLLGQHKSVKCPNCGWRFKCNHGINYVKCSNCFYKIRISDYRKRGGNRILVNKFIYDFGKPKRWDVTVFKYPFNEVTCMSCGFSSSQSMLCEKCTNAVKRENYFKAKINSIKGSFGVGQYHKVVCESCDKVDAILCNSCGSTNVHVVRKNYIKRLIGLPDEKLQILNGDIYINDKIERKPEKVQEALWVQVFDSNYPAKQEIVKNWKVEDEFWDIGTKQLELHLPEGTEQKSYISFKRKVTDYNVYNGEITDAINGDIMINFDASVSGNDGGISVILQENQKTIEAFVSTVAGNKKSYLKVSGLIVKSNNEVFVEPGKEYNIGFSNVDNKIILKLNDSVVFSYIYDTDLTSFKGYTKFSELKFGGKSISAVFKNISIFRDIYYTNVGEWGTLKPIDIGNNEYFFLGDNSRNSNDSRFWKTVPESNMVGKAFMVFWPPSTIKYVR